MTSPPGSLARLTQGTSSSSVAERLGSLFVVSNAWTLLLCSLGFLAIIITTSFTSFVQEIRSITAIAAATSRAALAFQDTNAAERVLSSLKDHRSIAAASLWSRNGEQMARFGVSQTNEYLLPFVDEDLRWSLGTLTVHEAVHLDGERVGTIIVTADLSSLYDQLLLMLLLALLVGGTVAWTASRFLRDVNRRVVMPIQNLRLLAQEVSVTKDFSHRLENTHDDEINELIKAFHHMLKQLEERDRCLLLAKDRAESADRAKSLFLASMSHEFRTPLHAILGMTDEMLETELSAEQRDLTETIKVAGDSLLSLINDILDLSKIEAGRLVLAPAPFALREFLSKTIKMFQHLYHKSGIALSYSVDPGVPEWICGDAGRLSQILVNLLGNSAKFTKTGGAVVVSVTKRTNERLPQGTHQLEWTVSDTGVGIPADKANAIFDAFFQVDRPGEATKGTGLGLAIVSRLVKLMSGWIWVDSIEGRGSTFKFVIDVDEATAPHSEKIREGEEGVLDPTTLREAHPTRGGPRSAPEQPRRTILVVEDNPVNMKLAVRILERQGYLVRSAANGRECLAMLQSTTVDLILMDVNMPEMDGLEATRRIRQDERVTGAHLPIIALTASVRPEDSNSCIDAGMDAFLSKPLARETLLGTIERYIGPPSPSSHARPGTQLPPDQS